MWHTLLYMTEECCRFTIKHQHLIRHWAKLREVGNPGRVLEDLDKFWKAME